MSDTSTKSIDDALFEARTIVNDTSEPFRNEDSTLIVYLNTALRVLYSIRPDAFIGDFSSGVITNNAVETYFVSDLGQNPPTPFPADDRLFFNPVVSYIAGRIEISDDEFSEDSRAIQLMAAMKQQLEGM